MSTAEIRSCTLKPKEERRIQRGHLWVYRNELERDPAIEDGALIDVFTEARRFLARGFYQASGGIAVRILSRHQEEIGTALLRERLDAARRWRERVFPGQNVYRWIFGESDGLPGLIVDRYASVAVVSSSCAYYAAQAETLLALLIQTPGIRGVVLNFQNRRAQHGEVPAPLNIEVEGVHLELDLSDAQKTGLFLDQRLNSLGIRAYAQGARVLDGHCYHGLWSCHAAFAGAASVVAADTSAAALEQARRNAALNGVADKCDFRCTDVEELLQNAEYDIIVLDPPAFAKTRPQLKKALLRYQALNTNALKALAPGGILITSSCSHFVSEQDFVEMLKRAAGAARRPVWQIALHGPAPDHPALLGMSETQYLKCAVLRG